MDYKKLYKEALEIIKGNLDALNEISETGADVVNIQSIKNCFYRAFPELAESKDERIRKALIQGFNECLDSSSHYPKNAIKYWHDIVIEDILAWLEKQESVEEIVERCKNSWYNEGKIAGMTEGLTDDEKYQQGWHDALEKQGEQKPADMVEPKFKVGDWVVKKDGEKFFGGSKVAQITKIDKEQYWFDCGTWLEDEDIRLWTIEDAKDGDVLVASDGSIFLFAGVVDCACKYYVAITTDNYVKINKEVEGGYWETSRAVHPATKEQCDTLFAEMKEAGYEWDAEKKELKKIEKERPLLSDFFNSEYERGKADAIKEIKSDWSEEDEWKFSDILALLRGGENCHYNTPDLFAWLKSLKERYTWKPSDEQMEALADALSLAKNCGEEKAFDLRTLYEQLQKIKENKL